MMDVDIERQTRERERWNRTPSRLNLVSEPWWCNAAELHANNEPDHLFFNECVAGVFPTLTTTLQTSANVASQHFAATKQLQSSYKAAGALFSCEQQRRWTFRVSCWGALSLLAALLSVTAALLRCPSTRRYWQHSALKLLLEIIHLTSLTFLSCDWTCWGDATSDFLDSHETEKMNSTVWSFILMVHCTIMFWAAFQVVLSFTVSFIRKKTTKLSDRCNWFKKLNDSKY